jgi:hypothetical protein
MLNRIQNITSDLKKKKTQKLVVTYASWIRQAVDTIPELTNITSAEDWQLTKIYRSASDMFTCWISPMGNATTFILYIPKSRIAYLSFEKRKSIMDKLLREAKLGEWRNFLPKMLHEGQCQGQSFWIEKCLPGVSGVELMQGASNHQMVLSSAIDPVSRLHKETTTTQIVGDVLLNKWITHPLEEILSSYLMYVFWHRRSFLRELGKEIEKKLRGHSFAVGWVHGDFWPGNILVNPDNNQVVGLVDWEDFETDFPPSLDLVNMMVSMRRSKSKKELGAIVVDLLKEGAWYPHEQAIWDSEEEKLDGNYLPLREALLLFWLHHISIGLKKSWRYAVNPLWVYGNFVTVLKFLQQG